MLSSVFDRLRIEHLFFVVVLFLLQRDVSGDDVDVFCELVSLNSITSWCDCRNVCSGACDISLAKTIE